PREYQAKAKNAQEANEAIRPTDFTKDPDSVYCYREQDAAQRSRWICQRTLADQASSADIERTSIDIDVKGKDGKTYGMRASGQVVRFDGFLKLYEEGVDDIGGA